MGRLGSQCRQRACAIYCVGIVSGLRPAKGLLDCSVTRERQGNTLRLLGDFGVARGIAVASGPQLHSKRTKETERERPRGREENGEEGGGRDARQVEAECCAETR